MPIFLPGTYPCIVIAMSEEAKEAPKKKAGKLPIIIACVVMLFTGGFFGLKMKGTPKEHGKPKHVALGEVFPLEEFLVNIGGTNDKTYLRTKLALRLKKDLPKEEVAKNTEMIQSAVNMELMQLTINDISSLSGKQKLIKTLIKAANECLNRTLDEKGGVEGDPTSQPVQDIYLVSFAYQ